MSKPPIDPVVWTPPVNGGLSGAYAVNSALTEADLWSIPGVGPEDVVVTDDGTIYTGTADGSIFAVADEGNSIRRVASTGGRPLGIELYGERLLVCDADKGLLALDPASGIIEPLVTEVDGTRLMLTNNAAVAGDGTIYFTESSRRLPLTHYMGDLIEHRATGRLLRRDPDGTVATLVEGLAFANGVALLPDESAVLVAETGSYRIIRLDLTGERAGATDVFAEMPGFPDNLSTGPSGLIWCAVASTRNGLLDALSSKPPVLRKMVWAIPDALLPGPAKVAFVVAYDADGQVVHNLQAHGQALWSTTGVREHDGCVYIGSLECSVIARYRLPG